MAKKEIRAKLSIPFEEKDRLGFIIEQNRKNGYQIEKLEDGSLQAFEMVKTEEELAKEEQDRINHLTCTALDLVTFIKSLEVSDEVVLAYLQANPSVQLQLTLCKDVYCGVVRQLCPIKVTEDLTITDEQIVAYFKSKHGIE